MGDLEEAVEHGPIFALLVGAAGDVENFTKLIGRIVGRIQHDPLDEARIDVALNQPREDVFVKFTAMRTFEARDFDNDDGRFSGAQARAIGQDEGESLAEFSG